MQSAELAAPPVHLAVHYLSNHKIQRLRSRPSSAACYTHLCEFPGSSRSKEQPLYDPKLNPGKEACHDHECHLDQQRLVPLCRAVHCWRKVCRCPLYCLLLRQHRCVPNQIFCIIHRHEMRDAYLAHLGARQKGFKRNNPTQPSMQHFADSAFECTPSSP